MVQNKEQTFLIEVLQETSRSRGDQQTIYALFEANLELLNVGFALILRKWASDIFSKSEAVRSGNIARLLLKFGSLIQNFTKGDLKANLEIAICAYETALIFFNRDEYPQEWGNSQELLIFAYQQRQQILYGIIAELREKQHEESSKTTHSHEINTTDESTKELSDLDTKAEIEQLKKAIARLEQQKSGVKKFNTAILYDIENLMMGNKNPMFNFSLAEIVNHVKAINGVENIAIQYAYADWSNNKLQTLRKEMKKLGIEAVQIFGFNAQKNAADIQLAIDAIEIIHNRSAIEVLVIVSGDGAFSSLAKKLHEYGKMVIGCAYKKQANRVLESVCDEFIWLSLQEDESGEITRPVIPSEVQINISDVQETLLYFKENDPYANLIKTDGIDLGEVSKFLKEALPDLDWKKQGYESFKRYLEIVCQGTDFELFFFEGDKTKSRLRLIIAD